MQTDLLTFSLARVTAADGGVLLLGDDFLPWIVLAFGAAMVVGNLLALLRPPQQEPDESRKDGRTTAAGKPPIGRVLVMIGIGAVAAVWGLASLTR